MEGGITVRFFFCLMMMVVGGCLGHGRLNEPPSRASAWRLGFNTPKDYNDNEGFCGGFSHQYETQDGKCGICGDPWEESPRAHEVGGLYTTGLIVRHYQEGQILNITVDITANHLGHFEFRICPDTDIEATQECLDRHRLSLADGTGVDYKISSEVGLYNVQLQLPSGLSCTHCVLQWRYQTGNNWGVCPDGTGALGCGPQEEFRACADISISSKKNLRMNEIDITDQSHKDLIEEESNKDLIEGEDLVPRTDEADSSILSCKGKGDWASLPGAAKWCTLNCNHDPEFCNKSLCECS